MAPLAGFEPATLSFVARRSYPLSYRGIKVWIVLRTPESYWWVTSESNRESRSLKGRGFAIKLVTLVSYDVAFRQQKSHPGDIPRWPKKHEIVRDPSGVHGHAAP